MEKKIAHNYFTGLIELVVYFLTGRENCIKMTKCTTPLRNIFFAGESTMKILPVIIHGMCVLFNPFCLPRSSHVAKCQLHDKIIRTYPPRENEIYMAHPSESSSVTVNSRGDVRIFLLKYVSSNGILYSSPTYCCILLN